MVKKNKQVSAFSSSAVVVDNVCTKKPKSKCPKRQKTRAEMDKHNKHCQESRRRVKTKYENMVAQCKKMEEQQERMQQEHKNQKLYDQEKISRLESDVLALRSDVLAFRSILQQKEEEIEKLKQSPSKWPFKEIGEREIGSAGELQELLFSEYDKYKQDGKWRATGFMTDIKQLCPDEPYLFDPLDFIVEPVTIEGNTGMNDSVAGSSDLGFKP